MKRLVSAAAAIGLGLAALVVPGTGPASAADPSTITDVQVDHRVVVSYPGKRVQDVIPTMRFTINLPSPTAQVWSIDVLGFAELGPGRRSLMAFNPECGETATCTRVGSAVTVSFKLKMDGYEQSSFGDNFWVPLEFPGTYAWQFEIQGDFGDFFFPALDAAAKTVGPSVTFKRATKLSLTAPTSVRKGSKIRLAGVAKLARTCTTYNRSVCSYGDTKWFVLPRRSLALVFDPAGSAPPRTRKTVVTDAQGRFSARLTQRVPGTWYAVLPATAKAAGDASPRRLVRIR